MKPFLRPTSRARLAPVGWTSEPAGKWGGREVEVVYDPSEHQVVLCRDDPGDQLRAEMADAGYRRCATDGTQEMWVRDRAVAAEQAAGRSVGHDHGQARPTIGLEAPGL